MTVSTTTPDGTFVDVPGGGGLLYPLPPCPCCFCCCACGGGGGGVGLWFRNIRVWCRFCTTANVILGLFGLNTL